VCGLALRQPMAKQLKYDQKKTLELEPENEKGEGVKEEREAAGQRLLWPFAW